MIPDAVTVAWKDLKEIFSQGGGGWRGNLRLFIFLGVFGIYLPAMTGPDWVKTPLTLAYWAWVPFFLVTGLVADAFAGERERHTLETLLASRLSDVAILLGKVGAAVAYGWGLTLATLVMGVVTLNVANWGQGLIMYPAIIFIAAVVLSLLTALLSAGVGVLVSLRAATVRQAAQTMSVATLLLLFVPMLTLRLLPQDIQLRLLQSVSGVGMTTVVIVAVLVLAALDGGFLLVALARFKRSRLILD